MNCVKIAYMNLGAALEAMRSVNRKPDRKKQITRAYLCPNCGWFHLTSMSQKKRRKVLFRKKVERLKGKFRK